MQPLLAPAFTSGTSRRPPPAPIPPASNLPRTPTYECGPSVFEARRAAWLSQRGPTASSSSSGSSSQIAPTAAPSSAGAEASLRRLEELLTMCDKAEGDDVPPAVWKAGLENVHRGLINGRKFAKPIPLGLTIKILRAGWLRDGTWPKNLPPVPDSPPFPPFQPPDALDDLPSGDGLALEFPRQQKASRVAAQGGKLVEEDSGSASETEAALSKETPLPT